jgi:hypothetical protein
VTLVVTNHGRSQAAEVEAILTARQTFGPVSADDQVPEVPEFELPVVSRGALQFELGRPKDSRIDLPPRSSRSLQVVMLGTDEKIREELKMRGEELPAVGHEAYGLFCVLPAPHADRYTVLPDDEPIGVEVQLQARNARPSNWKGQVKVWAWEMEVEGTALAGVTLDWLEPLKRARPHTLPTPRRAWLFAHSPRSLWRKRQFEREMKRLRIKDSGGATGLTHDGGSGDGNDPPSPEVD